MLVYSSIWFWNLLHFGSYYEFHKMLTSICNLLIYKMVALAVIKKETMDAEEMIK